MRGSENMSNRSSDEKYFDAILDQVLLDIEKEEIKKAEEIYKKFAGKPSFEVSLQHQLRMKEIIRTLEEKGAGNNGE
jgi:hypothetical protein